ncbi:hypothetical protein DID88_006230 [Monilinia fructigena]|uniref:Uncharacterized protein n=1 Tax=Monilinia fructigena TaxID=38457 RepID=A0A395J236_9HELO|nr:hypothetical protein DID88_006230 [Monilinia fructigena]
MGSKTYTVTDSTTLTITDCPCTYSTTIGKTVPTVPASSLSKPSNSVPSVVPSIPASSSSISSSVPRTSLVGPLSSGPPLFVSSYTTYCPSPTTVAIGNHTYTVSSATTLTVTKCPCTVSYTSSFPSYTAPVVVPTPSTITVFILDNLLPCANYHHCQLGPSHGHYPCTVTIPVVTVSVGTPVYYTPVPSAPASSAPVVSLEVSSPVASIPVASVPVATFPAASSSRATTLASTPATIASATTSGPAQFTGAAMRIDAGFGAMAIAGLAAFLL